MGFNFLNYTYKISNKQTTLSPLRNFSKIPTIFTEENKKNTSTEVPNPLLGSENTSQPTSQVNPLPPLESLEQRPVDNIIDVEALETKVAELTSKNKSLTDDVLKLREDRTYLHQEYKELNNAKIKAEQNYSSLENELIAQTNLNEIAMEKLNLRLENLKDEKNDQFNKLMGNYAEIQQNNAKIRYLEDNLNNPVLNTPNTPNVSTDHDITNLTEKQKLTDHVNTLYDDIVCKDEKLLELSSKVEDLSNSINASNQYYKQLTKRLTNDVNRLTHDNDTLEDRLKTQKKFYELVIKEHQTKLNEV